MEQTHASSPVQGQQHHAAAAPTQPAAAMSPPRQHHASYQPQQAQPFQQPAPYYAYGASPRVVPFDKNWYWAKIALTVASIVFAIILLGVSLGLALGPMSTIYSYGYEFVVIPLVIVCVVWDLAELLTVCICLARRRRSPHSQPEGQQQQQQHRQGIHPGAHVGVDLVLWLAGIVTLLFSISDYLESTYYDPYDCNTYYYHSSSFYEEYCNDDYLNNLKSFYIPAKRAVLAFICLLTITHFVIFVRACVETNQRNRMRGPVIMVPTQHLSMYLAPQQPGMMPMMPAQTYMAPGHQGASAVNEKSAAAHPHAHVTQSNAAPAEGFYAPSPSTAGHAGQAV
ncbi:uncharacterized protein PG986_010096 [Apiospora aurea]|uniref:Uncharacterized protein n=1 Tax=Apiospora aurea TaxID=335848 RepID=A0ABR1Q9U8_9PEZI